MRKHDRVREAELLKDIAETINGTYDMGRLLEVVLEKLLKLTGLAAGWVFLIEPRTTGELRCAADAGLPPALARDGKRPMTEGSCWCVDRYRDGRLQRAANILNCKRIEEATLLRRGDTNGLTHHATIPLRSGDALFGILNVGAPGKTAFTEEELSLLQSVALQIGTAAHRIRLYGQERKRALLFERLGAAARELRASDAPERIASDIVRACGETLGWSNAALWMRESQGLYLHAVYNAGTASAKSCDAPKKSCLMLDDVLETQRPRMFDGSIEPELLPSLAPIRGGAAVPLLLQGRPIGVLVAGSSTAEPFDEIDAEVLEALSAHAALTYENARLQEQAKSLARWEERNRIARDLHDSVSQMLFSLQLHARGLETALGAAGTPPDGARRAAEEIGRLSREALTEMRGMIRQLRPAGLEEGLLTGLAKYGAAIGLTVDCDAGALSTPMPERVELALWRIGQEALNNARKHAGVERAAVALSIEPDAVIMTVTDRGVGFAPGAGGFGFGLTTMRERAESVGGAVTVDGRPGAGTTVRVRLPLPCDGAASKEEGGEKS
ncbi:GAF domain-containing sensor histidine kinase [Paenibacillus sp.]|uniref:sensor histidine kinase n=1 Tax=Paenibacillus sp. TaxID=58172 RepID=UPI002D61FD1E|nr:GAF domain-containing sensor histidine kinase [Paenibacillus sp.]HZG55058.1 GAF domain-containing sensor histidine kinase [Paenibacillus sp.]